MAANIHSLAFSQPTGSSGRLVFPGGIGCRVYQGFRQGRHYGLDIIGPVAGASVPVLAAAAVERASRHGDYGNVVIVYHGQLIDSWHTYTLYGHLRMFTTGWGQTAVPEQMLGTSGATGGRCTGVHLHFELILLRNLMRFPPSGPIGIAGSVGRVDPSGYLARPGLLQLVR